MLVMLKNVIILIWKIIKKKTQLVKWSKISTQQPKTIENPNIGGTKSVIIEHLKTSHKLSKAIRQGQEVSQERGAGKNFDNPLYSETQKSESEIFWMKKKV